MKTQTLLATIAAAGLFAATALAQSPQTPQKEPGTTPAKDGSAGQKQSPEQPATGAGSLAPSKATADKADKADKATKPAQPGAGSDKPTPPAQSPEQKPQK